MDSPPSFHDQEAGSDVEAWRQGVRRIVTRAHRVLRDAEGNSNLVERFDEVSKVLFLAKWLADNERPPLEAQPLESAHDHAGRLRSEFERACQAYPQLFPERFRKLRLNDRALLVVTTVLAELGGHLDRQDVLGLAYEEVIRNTFEKGDNQQFFTPHTVVEFLVGMVDGDLNGRVCDPASGTGGFLVEVVRAGFTPAATVALEIDERLAWIAGMNLLLHGATRIEAHALKNGGTLGLEGLPFEQSFDTILTNPPFGSDFSGADELSHYELGRGRASRRRGVLFLERSLELLKEGGVLGIVIDDGVLSLPSNSDVRRLIRERAELLAVVSLPETAFKPYASVTTSILLLRKSSRPSPDTLTFYAQAERVGRKANGEPDTSHDTNGREVLNNDLPSILAAWRTLRETGALPQGGEDTFVVKLSDPASSGRFDERLDYRYHHPSRRLAESALASSRRPLLSLSDLCVASKETCTPRDDLADQVIPYTGLADIEPRTGVAVQTLVQANALKSVVRPYRPGDILFAKMRPSLRKVALVTLPEAGYASAECIVLKVRRDQGNKPIMEPLLLALLLRSDLVFGQVVHLIAGIGRPRLAQRDLMRVKIPVPRDDEQAAVLRDFEDRRLAYEAMRAKAQDLEQRARVAEQDALQVVADAALLGR